MAAKSNGGCSTHFFEEGEHGKSQCHHKRHGKYDHAHVVNVSHFGQLQQFCYNFITFSWPIPADTSGTVPGNYVENPTRY
jgi:hypothetical protein